MEIVIKTAIVIVGALGLAMALPEASVSATSIATQHRLSAQATDLSARRIDRSGHGIRRASVEAPHYYARPVYYRPYPYRVPWPFVLSFGPYW